MIFEKQDKAFSGSAAKEHKHWASLDTLRIHLVACSPASVKITPLRVTQVFQSTALDALALTLHSGTYRPHSNPFTHLLKHNTLCMLHGMQTAARVVSVSCQMLDVASSVKSVTP